MTKVDSNCQNFQSHLDTDTLRVQCNRLDPNRRAFIIDSGDSLDFYLFIIYLGPSEFRIRHGNHTRFDVMNSTFHIMIIS